MSEAHGLPHSFSDIVARGEAPLDGAASRNTPTACARRPPRQGRQASAISTISSRPGRASSASASLTAYCSARSAGRPGVGPGEAEQDVDVRRPRADALERGELGVNDLLGRVRQSVEVERAVVERVRQAAQRGDLDPRQAGAAQVLFGMARKAAGVNGRTRASSRSQIARRSPPRAAEPTITRASPLKPAGAAAQAAAAPEPHGRAPDAGRSRPAPPPLRSDRPLS